jgi:hypothetical protein
MGYAKHVGRVGALAVALGIGAAVATTPGVAWATEGDETARASVDGGTPGGSTGTPDTPTSPTERQDPGEAIRKGIERTADNLRKVVTGVVQSSGGAITSTHRTGTGANNGNGPTAAPEPNDKPQRTPLVAKDDNNNNAPRSFTAPRGLDPVWWTQGQAACAV